MNNLRRVVIIYSDRSTKKGWFHKFSEERNPHAIIELDDGSIISEHYSSVEFIDEPGIGRKVQVHGTYDDITYEYVPAIMNSILMSPSGHPEGIIEFTNGEMISIPLAYIAYRIE